MLRLLITYVSQSIARAVIRLINLTYARDLQLFMIYHSFAYAILFSPPIDAYKLILQLVEDMYIMRSTSRLITSQDFAKFRFKAL